MARTAAEAQEVRDTRLRLIKKYPNRRLYDTKTSSYITLADVKQMVLKQEDFQVVDAKSGDDLTRQILLQIILEEESGGAADVLLRPAVADHPLLRQRDAGLDGHLPREEHPGFQDMQKALQEQSQRIYGDNSRASQELWAQFMNLQGPAMQSLMQAYMEQSQKMFAQFQDQMQNQARNMFTGFPSPASPLDTQKRSQQERPREAAAQSRRSASSRSAVPRRWSTPSASSRSCAPRATPPRPTTPAPTSSSSTPAASSTPRSRSRSTPSARRWPRTAR